MSQAVATQIEHSFEVRRIPQDGHDVVALTGFCTCGWRSGTHHLYLGASTDWAEQRARHLIDRARDAHLRSD